jgi:methylmalonyl-CoA/ethylmalonyl-CoA epimerase
VLTNPGAGQFLGVDHIAVLVASIDEALPEFLDDLGLTMTTDEILAEPAVRLVHLDAGNVDLQLVQPLGPGKVADDLDRNGPGLHHVCFGVPALPEALAAFGEPDGAVFRGGQGRPACFLSRRPSQLYIELIEFADGTAYGTLSTATSRILAYWADECRRDLAALVTHFSKNAEVVTPDGSVRGHDAIAALYQDSFTTYPLLELDVTACYAGRGTHGFQYRAVLTDAEGIGWLIEGVNVMTLEDGAISYLRSFEDAPRRLPAAREAP